MGHDQRFTELPDATMQAHQRLARTIRALAQNHEDKLKQLKLGAQDLDRTDFVWRALVESFSSMGNSRGYEGLFGDPKKYERIAFDSLSSLPTSVRRRVLSETLRSGKVRMPDKKAGWLVSNFERIARMGGLTAAKAELLNRPDRDGKIAFLKVFDGIGDKYARNIMMNVYHSDFRQSIAVDTRIASISEALGLRFRSYEAHERFYLDVAKDAGLNGWEVDRLIYWFKEELLTRLGSKEACAH